MSSNFEISCDIRVIVDATNENTEIIAKIKPSHSVSRPLAVLYRIDICLSSHYNAQHQLAQQLYAETEI
ncbi:hypothetical protein N7537_004669 [Penicillium hordei]|uniref:Uncharacterized protein n=1 Tax=Penicillium hordei TaxID=40994 RepID=A0AAD6ECV6_9EURO|nr:uncharacterized protein N7537_004669 [Penicillium hordei]KAJ5608050.1 hypothetical protein N7537_004669 [Penicillium hordei]